MNQDKPMGEQDTITLSTGVVLRLKQVSPMVISSAIKTGSGEEPQVPTVWVEGKGREQPNPTDPDYLKAVDKWRADLGTKALRSLVAIGTEIEEIPEGVVGPDHEDYEDLMDSMGLDPGKGRYTRYVEWALHIACGSPKDFATLSATLMRRAGAREEDVREAQDAFRSDEERGADNGRSVQSENDNVYGDIVQPASTGVGP